MNECVAVLAVCEASQGHPHAFSLINQSCVYLRFLTFSSSLDPIYFGIIDQVALAVGTCVQRMHQLKVLSTISIKPLPLFQAMGDRECPLDHVKVAYSLWVCTILVWVY